MAATPPLAAALVGVWRQAGHKRWFAAAPAFDAELRDRFGAAATTAAAGGLADWSATAQGALAQVLLLDQLPRNLHRGSALAFAADPLARAAADAAILRGFDRETEPELRPFLYMPLEHAEDPIHQARSVALFSRYAQAGLDRRAWMRFALVHQEVIRRFGRFPHRNAALGRTPTPEETRFLAEGGFAG
ncbi:MAG: DUF924 domain-containing protein [Caulobacteraceae bacterium]|nr:DUF924 domain-containing protein [Caulobacter sp.]